METIYLDYNATSPIAEEVLQGMLPAFGDLWGNASSAHLHGQRAKQALERARGQVAALLGCEADEIVFTSGGTESDNAAVLGIVEARNPNGGHVVTSVVEHAAIEQACRLLERRGTQVTRVPVDSDGRVRVDDVVGALREETALVSIMHGQNETGVLQPVAEIGALLRARGIPFHCDAAQSVGKMPIRVDALQVDALTLAGHKFYGPKGVGALYLRRGTPFRSYLLGAGHEAGRRAGTENVPGVVGLGLACELATRELPNRQAHLQTMRDRLIEGLRAALPDAVVHGLGVERLPNTVSVALPGTVAVEVAAAAPTVLCGTGPACHSGRPHLSPTLTAMGLPEPLALATLRLSVGRTTTEQQVDAAAAALAQAATQLRTRTPA